jgi:FG-GAP-like repeat
MGPLMTPLHRSKMLGRFLLLMLLIAAAHIPGIAAVSGAWGPSVPGSNWIFSDFDGDQKPDLAELHRASLSISLSTGNQQKLFTFSQNDEPGTEIIAVDIDNDHDLDILVRNRFLPQSSNVWLNNGNGDFTETFVYHDPHPTQDLGLAQLRTSDPDLAIPIKPTKSKAVLVATSFVPSSSFDLDAKESHELHLVRSHTHTFHLRAPPAAFFT